MRIATGLILAALTWASAAAAQGENAGAVTGRWTGMVSEPGPDAVEYRMHAEIVLDRDGSPAGRVRYESLDCAGSWTAIGNFATSWRFREDITDDPDARCAPELIVETSPVGLDDEGLSVRWTEPGGDEPVATAILHRDP